MRNTMSENRSRRSGGRSARQALRAAPLAKELFKLIIDRHETRKNFDKKKYLDI